MERVDWYLFQAEVRKAERSFVNGDFQRAARFLQGALNMHPDAESAFEMVAEVGRSTFQAMLDDPDLEPPASRILELSAGWEMRLLADPSALAALATSYAQTRNEVFANKMRLLGAGMAPAIVSCLESAVTDKEKVNLVAALQGLGKEVALPLCHVLLAGRHVSPPPLAYEAPPAGRTASEGVKRHLIWVIGQVGDKRAWPILEAVAVDDSQPELVRQAARQHADRLAFEAPTSPAEYFGLFWTTEPNTTGIRRWDHVWYWSEGALRMSPAPQPICSFARLEFICSAGRFPRGWQEDKQANQAAALIALASSYRELAAQCRKASPSRAWPAAMSMAHIGTLSARWLDCARADVNAQLVELAEKKAQSYKDQAVVLGLEAVNKALGMAMVHRRPRMARIAAECLAELAPDMRFSDSPTALKVLVESACGPHLSGRVSVLVVGPKEFNDEVRVVFAAAGINADFHKALTDELCERAEAERPTAVLLADIDAVDVQLLKRLESTGETGIFHAAGHERKGFKRIAGPSPRQVARGLVREFTRPASEWLDSAQQACKFLIGLQSGAVPLVSRLFSGDFARALVVGHPDLQRQHITLAGRFGSEELVSPLVDVIAQTDKKQTKLDALASLRVVVSRTHAALTDEQLDMLLYLAGSGDKDVKGEVATLIGAAALSADQRKRALETFHR